MHTLKVLGSDHFTCACSMVFTSSHMPLLRRSSMRILVNSKLLWDLANSNMCIMHNVTISAPLPL